MLRQCPLAVVRHTSRNWNVHPPEERRAYLENSLTKDDLPAIWWPIRCSKPLATNGATNVYDNLLLVWNDVDAMCARNVDVLPWHRKRCLWYLVRTML